MIIPYLREDLEIFRGNSREDGSPAWLLYDDLRNKYFTLGLTAVSYTHLTLPTKA